MILSYSKDEFVKKIQDGIKIHSMRADPKCRWKVGMVIHQWRRNPRNVKANPYHIQNNECKNIQEVRLEKSNKIIEGLNFRTYRIIVDDRELTPYEIQDLSLNDGFENINDLFDFFIPDESGEKNVRLIHWTDKKY